MEMMGPEGMANVGMQKKRLPAKKKGKKGAAKKMNKAEERMESKKIESAEMEY